MGKAKRPAVAHEPVVEKRVSYRNFPTDTESRERVSWRIGDADTGGEWSWLKLPAAKVTDVQSMLAEMEKVTWVTAAPRIKAVPASGVCKDARDRLVEIQRDDVDDLMEIRLGNRPRIWGVRRGNAFHILWWDPEHSVWPTEPRNT